MLEKILLGHCFVLAVSGCGYGSYEKTDEGRVENMSQYTLEVNLSEGCRSGSSHTFNVAPGETKPFSYTYKCDGYDEDSASIRVRYVEYDARGYVYYSFNPSAYSNTLLTEGSSFKYSEDTNIKDHTVTLAETDALPSEGLRTDLMVFTLGQEIRIRPSGESVSQIYFGINEVNISPFIPLLEGHFVDGDTIYQPMSKDYYQHKPHHYGRNLSLVCDDISCVSIK